MGDSDSNPRLLLTVYWCGTAGTIADQTTQVGIFANATRAAGVPDITLDLKEETVDIRSISEVMMAFDGVGQTHGCRGMLFAHGLRSQCTEVANRVRDFLAVGRSVQVNLFGLSRGAIGCMYAIQDLGSMDPERVRVHAILFDPVPGHQVCTSKYLDWCGCCWALRRTADLSASKNLISCLALFPSVPLPDVAFHAPTIPSFPKYSNVTVDVTLGCHQGALFHPRINVESMLSFIQIYQFLDENGTTFAPEVISRVSGNRSLEELREFMLDVMERRLQAATAADATVRKAHSSFLGDGIAVICDSPGAHIRYLNRFHQHLAKASSGGTNNNDGEGFAIGGDKEQQKNVFLLRIAHGGCYRPWGCCVCFWIFFAFVPGMTLLVYFVIYSPPSHARNASLTMPL